MYYKVIYVYLFSCVFLCPYVISDKSDVLTMYSSKPSLLQTQKSIRVANFVQQFYYYSYSDEDVVYFNCKAIDSVQNPKMEWAVDRPPTPDGKDRVTCPERNNTELNRIVKLTKFHNGNNLTCELIADGLRATAQVRLSCPKCGDVNENFFNSSCGTKNGVNIYVNGSINNNIIEVKKNNLIIIHCEIDIHEDDTVKFENNTLLKRLSASEIFPEQLSNSVATLQFNMTEDLNGTEIVCVKKSKNKPAKRIATLRLQSAFIITIRQPGEEPRSCSGEIEELEYHDNQTVNFSCSYHGSEVLPLVWLENGEQKEKKRATEITYNIILKEENDNNNLTCMVDLSPFDKRTIVFKYINPTIAPEENTETTYITSSTSSTAATKTWNETEKMFGIGVPILLLLIIVIAFVTYKCRRVKPTTSAGSSQSARPVTNENTYAPEPTLDPVYSGPVDDLNIYSYTTPQQLPQNTYSTPFVPTIEEMYTQPTPKVLRLIGEPTYPLPGRQYANVQNSRRNQPDPGYSSVANDGSASDNASETYTYCSVPGYSRVD